MNVRDGNDETRHMAPQITKHEKIVVAHTADAVIGIWTAVRMLVPTVERDAVDKQIVELRRMLTPQNPNQRPAPVDPPPSSPQAQPPNTEP